MGHDARGFAGSCANWRKGGGAMGRGGWAYLTIGCARAHAPVHMHERKYAIWTIDVIHVKDGVGIAILVPLARNIHLVHALERLNNVRGGGEERLKQLRH